MNSIIVRVDKALNLLAVFGVRRLISKNLIFYLKVLLLILLSPFSYSDHASDFLEEFGSQIDFGNTNHLHDDEDDR